MDKLDVVFWVGIVLLGIAIYLWLGLAAVLGYAGTVLVFVGIAAAYARERHGVSRETKAK